MAQKGVSETPSKVTRDRSISTKYISEFKSNVDFAVDLGIKGIRVDCVQPPTIHAEEDFDTLFDRLTKTWDTCINYAADKGIYVTW